MDRKWKKNNNNNNVTHTYTIIPTIISHIIGISNSREHLSIYIIGCMVEYKLGEFVAIINFYRHVKNDN